MSLSKDFIEFIESFNKNRVNYLLVGGHALAFHGLPRFTKDIDFWVEPNRKNAVRVLAALKDFGFSDFDLTEEDFCKPGQIIQLGMPPNRIDLVTSIDGVEFGPAFQRKIISPYKDTQVVVIHIDDLIANKKATGREQDLLDVKNLLSAADL